MKSWIDVAENGGRMGILKKHRIAAVFHFAPLHYLAFIARSQSLRCKSSLKKGGFQEHHLRTKSRKIDVKRGFGSYTHLTLHEQPNILKAKLEAGFPHISISVPVDAVEAVSFCLCRYNIAMARQVRVNGHGGFEESDTNGRYYDGHQIPVAKYEGDMDSMLAHHLNKGTMIEVLIQGGLPLPDETKVICYSKEDAELSHWVLNDIGRSWKVATVQPPVAYSRNAKHVEAVNRFTKRALADPDWRGDGLEFDRFE